MQYTENLEFYFGKGTNKISKIFLEKLKNYTYEPDGYKLSCKSSYCVHDPIDLVFCESIVNNNILKSTLKIGWYVHENFLSLEQQEVLIYQIFHGKLFYDSFFDSAFMLENINKMLQADFAEEFLLIFYYFYFLEAI